LAYLGLLGACFGQVPVRARAAPFENECFHNGWVWVRWGRPSLTQRTRVSTLKQSPESRRYGCDPGWYVWGPRRPAARPPPTGPRTNVVANRERPDGNARSTRRTPWPRASGPSSRITGAEPACMASACGCVPAQDVPSCPTGAAKAAARYLPDRTPGFWRCFPHATA
jgi:hypothetical protein